MLRRSFWFLTGAIAGGVVTVRALRRRPTVRDLRKAAVITGADMMGLAAKAVRPNSGGPQADAR
jgi:hypothetical protein